MKKLLVMLSKTIGIQPEEVKKIEFSGGMTNKNYRIILNDGKELQMRIPGIGAEQLVNRQNEYFNTKVIEGLGINVPSLYMNAQNGVKITEYVHCSQVLSKKTAKMAEHLKQVAFILKTLHTSNVQMNNTFAHMEIMQTYEAVILTMANKAFLKEKFPNFTQCKNEIAYLSDKVQQFKSFSIAPCHNDVVPENIIISNDHQMFLIDWEYSGFNSFFWDLAAFSLESELTQAREKKFLDFYFQRCLLTEEYFQLNFYKAVQDILWSLWAMIKELHGESFGQYGQRRYERGYTLLKKLIITDAMTVQHKTME